MQGERCARPPAAGVPAHVPASHLCAGLVARAGWYKDWPLYDGRAIEAFARPADAEKASRARELRFADGAAAYLRIRRAEPGALCAATHMAGRRPTDT